MRVQVRRIENFLVARFRKRGKEVSNLDIAPWPSQDGQHSPCCTHWQLPVQAPQHKLAATPEAMYSFVSDNKIALW